MDKDILKMNFDQGEIILKENKIQMNLDQIDLK
jgi:hypothetical protein